MTKHLAIIVLLSVLTFGCVAPQPRVDWTNPQEVTSRIETQYDNLKKVTTFTGPNCASDRGDTLFIRAWKADATSEITYQIYVKNCYLTPTSTPYSADGATWRFYGAANDENRTALDVLPIARSVADCKSSSCNCIFCEEIGINATREYLVQHQDGGIKIKLIGKGGEEIFSIPSGYVRAFFNAAK